MREPPVGRAGGAGRKDPGVEGPAPSKRKVSMCYARQGRSALPGPVSLPEAEGWGSGQRPRALPRNTSTSATPTSRYYCSSTVCVLGRRPPKFSSRKAWCGRECEYGRAGPVSARAAGVSPRAAGVSARVYAPRAGGRGPSPALSVEGRRRGRRCLRASTRGDVTSLGPAAGRAGPRADVLSAVLRPGRAPIERAVPCRSYPPSVRDVGRGRSLDLDLRRLRYIHEAGPAGLRGPLLLSYGPETITAERITDTLDLGSDRTPRSVGTFRNGPRRDPPRRPSGFNDDTRLC